MEQAFDFEELEALWEQALSDAFQFFVDEHIGLDADGVPDCFTSGGNHSFCQYCDYQKDCEEQD